MARSQNSYTFDVDTNLKVSAAETTSGAEALIVDLGVGYVEFDVVVDVATMERGGATEVYEVLVQLGDVAAMTSGVVVGAGGLHFGEEVGANGSADADALGGRQVIRCNNERLGTQFRFVRLANIISGAGAPSITYGAFLTKL